MLVNTEDFLKSTVLIDDLKSKVFGSVDLILNDSMHHEKVLGGYIIPYLTFDGNLLRLEFTQKESTLKDNSIKFIPLFKLVKDLSH